MSIWVENTSVVESQLTVSDTSEADSYSLSSIIVSNNLTGSNLDTTGLTTTTTTAVSGDATLNNLSATTGNLTTVSVGNVTTVSGALTATGSTTTSGTVVVSGTVNASTSAVNTSDIAATTVSNSQTMTNLGNVIADRVDSALTTAGTGVKPQIFFNAVPVELSGDTLLTGNHIRYGYLKNTNTSTDSTWTLPSSTSVIAETNAPANTSWEVVVINNTSKSLTLVANTGVLLSGNSKVERGTSVVFIVCRLDDDTFTVFHSNIYRYNSTVSSSTTGSLTAADLAVAGSTSGNTLSIVGSLTSSDMTCTNVTSDYVELGTLTVASASTELNPDQIFDTTLTVAGSHVIPINTCRNKFFDIPDTDSADLALNVSGTAVGKRVVILIRDAKTGGRNIILGGGLLKDSSMKSSIRTSQGVIALVLDSPVSGTVVVSDYIQNGTAVLATLYGYNFTRNNIACSTAIIRNINGDLFIAGDLRTPGQASEEIIPHATVSLVNGDHTGTSICVSQDGLWRVIGNKTAANTGGICGAIFIHKMIDSTWTTFQTIYCPDGNSSEFGTKVAMCNNTIVVSAPKATYSGVVNHGKVYAYALGSETWSLFSTLNPTSPLATNSEMGSALSITSAGTTVAVGTKDPTCDVRFFTKSSSWDGGYGWACPLGAAMRVGSVVTGVSLFDAGVRCGISMTGNGLGNSYFVITKGANWGVISNWAAPGICSKNALSDVFGWTDIGANSISGVLNRNTEPSFSSVKTSTATNPSSQKNVGLKAGGYMTQSIKCDCNSSNGDYLIVWSHFPQYNDVSSLFTWNSAESNSNSESPLNNMKGVLPFVSRSTNPSGVVLSRSGFLAYCPALTNGQSDSAPIVHDVIYVSGRWIVAYQGWGYEQFRSFDGTLFPSSEMSVKTFCYSLASWSSTTGAFERVGRLWCYTGNSADAFINPARNMKILQPVSGGTTIYVFYVVPCHPTNALSTIYYPVNNSAYKTLNATGVYSDAGGQTRRCLVASSIDSATFGTNWGNIIFQMNGSYGQVDAFATAIGRNDYVWIGLRVSGIVGGSTSTAYGVNTRPNSIMAKYAASPVNGTYTNVYTSELIGDTSDLYNYAINQGQVVDGGYVSRSDTIAANRTADPTFTCSYYSTGCITYSTDMMNTTGIWQQGLVSKVATAGKLAWYGFDQGGSQGMGGLCRETLAVNTSTWDDAGRIASSNYLGVSFFQVQYGATYRRVRHSEYISGNSGVNNQTAVQALIFSYQGTAATRQSSTANYSDTVTLNGEQTTATTPGVPLRLITGTAGCTLVSGCPFNKVDNLYYHPQIVIVKTSNLSGILEWRQGAVNSFYLPATSGTLIKSHIGAVLSPANLTSGRTAPYGSSFYVAWSPALSVTTATVLGFGNRTAYPFSIGNTATVMASFASADSTDCRCIYISDGPSNNANTASISPLQVYPKHGTSICSYAVLPEITPSADETISILGGLVYPDSASAEGRLKTYANIYSPLVIRAGIHYSVKCVPLDISTNTFFTAWGSPRQSIPDGEDAIWSGQTIKIENRSGLRFAVQTAGGLIAGGLMRTDVLSEVVVLDTCVDSTGNVYILFTVIGPIGTLLNFDGSVSASSIYIPAAHTTTRPQLLFASWSSSGQCRGGCVVYLATNHNGHYKALQGNGALYTSGTHVGVVFRYIQNATPTFYSPAGTSDSSQYTQLYSGGVEGVICVRYALSNLAYVSARVIAAVSTVVVSHSNHTLYPTKATSIAYELSSNTLYVALTTQFSSFVGNVKIANISSGVATEITPATYGAPTSNASQVILFGWQEDAPYLCKTIAYSADISKLSSFSGAMVAMSSTSELAVAFSSNVNYLSTYPGSYRTTVSSFTAISPMCPAVSNLVAETHTVVMKVTVVPGGSLATNSCYIKANSHGFVHGSSNIHKSIIIPHSLLMTTTKIFLLTKSFSVTPRVSRALASSIQTYTPTSTVVLDKYITSIATFYHDSTSITDAHINVNTTESEGVSGAAPAEMFLNKYGFPTIVLRICGNLGASTRMNPLNSATGYLTTSVFDTNELDLSAYMIAHQTSTTIDSSLSGLLVRNVSCRKLEYSADSVIGNLQETIVENPQAFYNVMSCTCTKYGIVVVAFTYRGTLPSIATNLCEGVSTINFQSTPHYFTAVGSLVYSYTGGILSGGTILVNTTAPSRRFASCYLTGLTATNTGFAISYMLMASSRVTTTYDTTVLYSEPYSATTLSTGTFRASSLNNSGVYSDITTYTPPSVETHHNSASVNYGVLMYTPDNAGRIATLDTTPNFPNPVYIHQTAYHATQINSKGNLDPTQHILQNLDVTTSATVPNTYLRSNWLTYTSDRLVMAVSSHINFKPYSGITTASVAKVQYRSTLGAASMTNVPNSGFACDNLATGASTDTSTLGIGCVRVVNIVISLNSASAFPISHLVIAERQCTGAVYTHQYNSISQHHITKCDSDPRYNIAYTYFSPHVGGIVSHKLSWLTSSNTATTALTPGGTNNTVALVANANVVTSTALNKHGVASAHATNRWKLLSAEPTINTLDTNYSNHIRASCPGYVIASVNRFDNPTTYGTFPNDSFASYATEEHLILMHLFAGGTMWAGVLMKSMPYRNYTSATLGTPIMNMCVSKKYVYILMHLKTNTTYNLCNAGINTNHVAHTFTTANNSMACIPYVFMYDFNGNYVDKFVLFTCTSYDITGTGSSASLTVVNGNLFVSLIGFTSGIGTVLTVPAIGNNPSSQYTISQEGILNISVPYEASLNLCLTGTTSSATYGVKMPISDTTLAISANSSGTVALANTTGAKLLKVAASFVTASLPHFVVDPPSKYATSSSGNWGAGIAASTSGVDVLRPTYQHSNGITSGSVERLEPTDPSYNSYSGFAAPLLSYLTSSSYTPACIALTDGYGIVAIGVPDFNPDKRGSVLIYNASSGSWTFQIELRNYSSVGVIDTNSSRFGVDVALSSDGKVLAVADPTYGTAASGHYLGRIIVFSTASSWFGHNSVRATILVPSAGNPMFPSIKISGAANCVACCSVNGILVWRPALQTSKIDTIAANSVPTSSVITGSVSTSIDVSHNGDFIIGCCTHDSSGSARFPYIFLPTDGVTNGVFTSSNLGLGATSGSRCRTVAMNKTSSRTLPGTSSDGCVIVTTCPDNIYFSKRTVSGTSPALTTSLTNLTTISTTLSMFSGAIMAGYGMVAYDMASPQKKMRVYTLSGIASATPTFTMKGSFDGIVDAGVYDLKINLGHLNDAPIIACSSTPHESLDGQIYNNGATTSFPTSIGATVVYNHLAVVSASSSTGQLMHTTTNTSHYNLGEAIATNCGSQVVVIGSPNTVTISTNQRGAVRIDLWTGNGWSTVRTFNHVELGGGSDSLFVNLGSAVAMKPYQTYGDSSSTTIAVSDPDYNGYGKVWIITTYDNFQTYNIAGTYTGSEPGARFGASIALSDYGDAILIGAPNSTVTSGATYTNAGKVYYAVLSGTWQTISATYTSPTPANDGNFGASVKILGAGYFGCAIIIRAANENGSCFLTNNGTMVQTMLTGVILSVDLGLGWDGHTMIYNTYDGVYVRTKSSYSATWSAATPLARVSGRNFTGPVAACEDRVYVSDTDTVWTTRKTTLTKLDAISSVAGVTAIAANVQFVAVAHKNEPVGAYTGVVRIYGTDIQSNIPRSIGARTAPGTPQYAPNFGTSVDLTPYGNVMIVGSTDATSTSEGMAHIYLRKGDGWVLEQSLSAATASASNFGEGVSLNEAGTIAAVSDSTLDKVWIWSRSSLGVWENIGYLTSTTVASYGECVYLSGNGLKCFVSDPHSTAGKVHVYHLSSTRFEPNSTPNATILATTNTNLPGKSISANYEGTVVVIGAPLANSGKGEVYALKYNGSVWGTPTAYAPLGSIPANDNYGYSVAHKRNSGSMVFCARGNTAAHITTYDASLVLQTQVAIPGTRSATNGCVALGGNSMFISEPTANTNMGIIYEYDMTGTLLASYNGDEPTTTFGRKIVADMHGNVLVGTNSGSSVKTNLTNIGKVHAFSTLKTSTSQVVKTTEASSFTTPTTTLAVAAGESSVAKWSAEGGAQDSWKLGMFSESSCIAPDALIQVGYVTPTSSGLFTSSSGGTSSITSSTSLISKGCWAISNESGTSFSSGHVLPNHSYVNSWTKVTASTSTSSNFYVVGIANNTTASIFKTGGSGLSTFGPANILSSGITADSVNSCAFISEIGLDSTVGWTSKIIASEDNVLIVPRWFSSAGYLMAEVVIDGLAISTLSFYSNQSSPTLNNTLTLRHQGRNVVIFKLTMSTGVCTYSMVCGGAPNPGLSLSKMNIFGGGIADGAMFVYIDNGGSRTDLDQVKVNGGILQMYNSASSSPVANTNTRATAALIFFSSSCVVSTMVLLSGTFSTPNVSSICKRSADVLVTVHNGGDKLYIMNTSGAITKTIARKNAGLSVNEAVTLVFNLSGVLQSYFVAYDTDNNNGVISTYAVDTAPDRLDYVSGHHMFRANEDATAAKLSSYNTSDVLTSEIILPANSASSIVTVAKADLIWSVS